MPRVKINSVIKEVKQLLSRTVCSWNILLLQMWYSGMFSCRWDGYSFRCIRCVLKFFFYYVSWNSALNKHTVTEDKTASSCGFISTNTPTTVAFTLLSHMAASFGSSNATYGFHVPDTQIVSCACCSQMMRERGNNRAAIPTVPSLSVRLPADWLSDTQQDENREALPV